MPNRSCQIPGCQGRHVAKGYCAKHYQAHRLQKKHDPSRDSALQETAAAVERTCQIPGCQGAYYAKGFCASHYQKNRILSMTTSSSQEVKGAGHSTGITRQLDNLGRIVLPIELRRSLNIEISDSLEIFVDRDMLILRKYSPGCTFCGTITMDSIYFKGRVICQECNRSCNELIK